MGLKIRAKNFNSSVYSLDRKKDLNVFDESRGEDLRSFFKFDAWK